MNHRVRDDKTIYRNNCVTKRVLFLTDLFELDRIRHAQDSFFLVFTRQIYRHCCRLASSRYRTQAHRWRALQLLAVQNVIRRLSPVHTYDKVERAEFDFVVSVTETAHEVEFNEYQAVRAAATI